MDLDCTFAKVVGRAPTANEQVYLQRLGRTWDIRGNETLVALLFVFCFGATRWQSCPVRCAESVRHTVKRRLVVNGETLAQPRSDGRLALSVATVGTGLAFIGGVGVLGVALGVSTTFRLNVPAALLPLLTIRCGWSILGTMIMPASSGALWGWSRARNGASNRLARRAGWATFAAVNLALCGWVLVLLTL